MIPFGSTFSHFCRGWGWLVALSRVLRGVYRASDFWRDLAPTTGRRDLGFAHSIRYRRPTGSLLSPFHTNNKKENEQKPRKKPRKSSKKAQKKKTSLLRTPNPLAHLFPSSSIIDLSVRLPSLSHILSCTARLRDFLLLLLPHFSRLAASFGVAGFTLLRGGSGGMNERCRKNTHGGWRERFGLAGLKSAGGVPLPPSYLLSPLL